MTIQELILYSIQQLPDPTTSRIDVEVLLTHILHCTQATLRAHPEQEIPDNLVVAFETLFARRILGEPIAYIVGERHFWNFSVAVSGDVLIPRPETEILVEQALVKIKQYIDVQKGVKKAKELNVLDLGTGSGIIAIALALEIPEAYVYALDCSIVALQIAKRNAAKNNVNSITFVHGNWFEPLQQHQGYFHCIISNPPYIAKGDPALCNKELIFEPQHALTSGPLGLDALTTIISQGRNFLADGGWLLVEHGYNQATQVIELFRNSNYGDISSHKDLSGYVRITCGCKL